LRPALGVFGGQAEARHFFPPKNFSLSSLIRAESMRFLPSSRRSTSTQTSLFLRSTVKLPSVLLAALLLSHGSRTEKNIVDCLSFFQTIDAFGQPPRALLATASGMASTNSSACF